MAVSRQEFLRFLLGTLKTAGPLQCQHCGDASEGRVLINVNGPDGKDQTLDPAELHIPFANPKAPTTPSYHAYFATTCSKCGLTDFFHKGIVLEWLRNHPNQGGLG